MTGSSSTGTPRPRIPALDALRGFAVLLVVTFHLTIAVPGAPLSRVTGLTGLGWIGVDLFFVLSGFLITGILLETRGRSDYFRRFYIRRARRILPVASLTLAALCFVVPHLSAPAAEATAPLRASQGWYWLYLNNWSVDWWRYSTASHYWSLAIEEQFYLVWPVVVLLCRTPRRLTLVCAACIGGALLLRCVLLAAGVSPDAVYLNTFCRVDGLAWGALVAVTLSHPMWRERAVTLARSATVPLGYSWLAVVLASWAQRTHPVMQTVGYSLLAVASAVVLVRAVSGSDGISRRLTAAVPLQRLGTVSYGLYVFHHPLRDLAMAHGWTVEQWTRTTGSWLAAQLLFYVVIGGGSLLLALVSWRWLERPLLYGRSPSRRSAPVLVTDAAA